MRDFLAGECGQHESKEMQQREMRSPTPGEEQLHAPVGTGGQLSGKQLYRKGSGPAVCPHDKGLWHRGLR